MYVHNYKKSHLLIDHLLSYTCRLLSLRNTTRNWFRRCSGLGRSWRRWSVS